MGKLIETFVPTEGVVRYSIHLVVHLRVRFRGRGAAEEDNIGVGVEDKFLKLLSSPTWFRECPHTVGLVSHDKVPPPWVNFM